LFIPGTGRIYHSLSPRERAREKGVIRQKFLFDSLSQTLPLRGRGPSIPGSAIR
jgi:hypothetical protein